MMRRLALFAAAVLTIGGFTVTRPAIASAATAVQNSSRLDLDLGVGEDLAIATASGNFVFRLLAGATWTEVGTIAGVTGFGSDTLTIDPAAFTKITVTDEGAGSEISFVSPVDNLGVELQLLLDGPSSRIDASGVVSTPAPVPLVLYAERIDVSGAFSVTTSSLKLAGDVVDVAAAITAPGAVTIVQRADGYPIDLGSTTDAAAALEVSDAELDRIDAPTIRVGNESSGDVTVTASISPLLASTLTLQTGGALIDGHASGADFVVPSLGLQAVDGIADDGADIVFETNIDTLAALNTGTGGISVVETVAGGDLTIGAFDGLVGATIEAGGGKLMQIETNDGDLTIDAAVTGVDATLFLVAQEGNGGSGDRTLTNNATISADTAGNHRLMANNMALAGGTIDVGTSPLIITTDTSASVPVGLDLGGADGVNVLGLTQAELLDGVGRLTHPGAERHGIGRRDRTGRCDQRTVGRDRRSGVARIERQRPDGQLVDPDGRDRRDRRLR